jgi:hypothetical protein
VVVVVELALPQPAVLEVLESLLLDTRNKEVKMAHWAEIDENNIVLRVIVGDNNDPNGDEGYQWIIENLAGTWVKTSYNANIRKNFAGLGFTYDENRDAFIPPKPVESWILDEETCRWVDPEEPKA